MTITSPGIASLGLSEYSYQFVLIPEHIFPLVITTFGRYKEILSNQDLVINFTQTFDSDLSAEIYNTFSCETACGKSCDYLNAEGLPRKLTGTFADVTTTKVSRSITFAQGQLEQGKLYKITINAKYRKLQGSKTVEIRVLDPDFNGLTGDWTVFGINGQGFGLAGFEASLRVDFPFAIDHLTGFTLKLILMVTGKMYHSTTLLLMELKP